MAQVPHAVWGAACSGIWLYCMRWLMSQAIIPCYIANKLCFCPEAVTIDLMQTINLTGHFLIAMPSMADMRFSRTLTYICEHNEQGALGVIVNRPVEMKMAELFSQIGTALTRTELAGQPLYFGGPVETGRGFVLHQPIGQWQSTLAVNGVLGLTTSKDILEAIGQGDGPDKLMVTLGCAGWEAGQLEDELGQNAWLSVAADAHVIFDLPADARLEAAMQLLGVDYANLSEDAGHA